MINSPIFINKFQSGSEENANLGFGSMVGVETYTKKGVAQVSRDLSKVSGSVVTELIKYFTIESSSGGNYWGLGENGQVYKTTNGGSTWTNTGSISGTGRGAIFFEGYLFVWNSTTLYYTTNGSSFTAFSPSDGSSATLTTGVEHFPFLFPNDGFVYFGNGSKIGKFGFGTAATFNPAGTPGTDYFYSSNWGPISSSSTNGLLPSTYTVNCISFLPTNYLALGTGSSKDPSVADVILWNPTLSTYETPLRLYSQSPISENGVKQIINRNNVLYAITGGNQCIFSTNGSSFSEVANISLYSNIRKPTGTESQEPVFISPTVSAIEVMGNKLMTGTSNSGQDSAFYPTGYGLYPCGIWTVDFSEGDQSIQCEYVISTGTTVAVNKIYSIGAIKYIGRGQCLISWRDDTTYGIDIISSDEYQDTVGNVMIESEMMEIGTPLEPAKPGTIQINTPRQLIAGQTIVVNYRTGFDQDYASVQTFTTADNPSYKITSIPFDPTRFLQLQIQMNAGSDETYTPMIRNIIISK